MLGEPFAVDDQDERALFGLLHTLSQPTPPVSFVRSLEQSLALRPSPDTAVIAPAPPRIPRRTTRRDNGDGIVRPSRWRTAGYALAAIALVILFSTVAISRQPSGLDDGPAIPAVSQWTDQGPPTSPGVETTPLFAHTYTVDELANYALDQWGWVELVRGTVGPGARSFEDLTRVNTNEIPGISAISVYSGQLNARLVKAAVVYRQNGANSESISGPAEISVGAGDTLVFGAGSLAELWNPTDADTAYIAGGLYTKPGDPVLFTDDRTNTLPQGISFQVSIFAGVSSLELSTDRVAVEPGQTFAYSITPQTLFLASVVGDGLEKQEWANGERQGNARTLVPSSYSFHQDGPGYYTLTNDGTETVDIYLLKVVPPDALDSQPDAPVSHVDTLFSRTLDQADLAAYQSDEWKWIGMTEGTMPPSGQAVIAEGSPEAGDIGFNGVGAISVTSGTLIANAAQGAMVERGATGAVEPIDRSADVPLEAGDTLIVPANTLPAIWNTSDTDATYVTGGVYTTSNITPLNEMDFSFTRGGIQTDPNDLAVGAPVTMSLQQVSIPPGANYSYSVSSETWLEAITSGGELQQEKRIGGELKGEPKRLVESTYSLHADGFGEYTLTNEGNTTVDVSFFRVEAVDLPDAAATPVALDGTLVDQTLSASDLQGFRIEDWRWIQFSRNTMYPLSDSASPQSDVASCMQLLPAGRNVVPGLNLMAVESGELMVAPDWRCSLRADVREHSSARQAGPRSCSPWVTRLSMHLAPREASGIQPTPIPW